MASVNSVTLIGNVGKEPEMRHTTSGSAVTSFSLATSEKYKKLDGEWEEKTEWHNIVFFGKLAEVCGAHLAKGKSVYILGKLQTRKWQDKDGNDRYTTEIVGDKLQMLSPKTSSSSDSDSAADYQGDY